MCSALASLGSCADFRPRQGSPTRIAQDNGGGLLASFAGVGRDWGPRNGSFHTETVPTAKVWLRRTERGSLQRASACKVSKNAVVSTNPWRRPQAPQAAVQDTITKMATSHGRRENRASAQRNSTSCAATASNHRAPE